MLGYIADKVAGLGQALSGGDLGFAPAAGGALRAEAHGYVFEMFADPAGRRRHVAAITPPGGRRGFLARGGEAACRAACASALGAIRDGAVLAVVDCDVPHAGATARVPCAVSLRRSPDGGLLFGFLPRRGAEYEVRQSFLPNFLTGTVPKVTFRVGAEPVGGIDGVSDLLQACLDARGLLRPGERGEASWGVALARTCEAGGPGPEANRDRRSVEILRERDRIERSGGACSERVKAMCAVAVDHLMGRPEVWQALAPLPEGARIEAWAAEADAGLAPRP